MGKSKEKYIEIHDPLEKELELARLGYYGLIQKIIKDEELLYERLYNNDKEKEKK